MISYKYIYSLRVTHDERDPIGISNALSQLDGITLKKNWKKGEPRGISAGVETKHKSYYYNFSFFSDSQISDDRTLENSLENSIALLKPLTVAFSEFAKDGGRSSLFIGLFINSNSGISISKDLLSDLDSLSIDLEFDIYPPDDK